MLVVIMVIVATAVLALAFSVKEKPLQPLTLEQEKAYDKFEKEI